ncbi:MAG: Rv0909 family putative TA system antitoxin [bacterium]
MPGLDDLKDAADSHDDQLDSAMEKGGDALSDKAGHGDQLDSAVDKAQDATGGDSE